MKKYIGVGSAGRSRAAKSFVDIKRARMVSRPVEGVLGIRYCKA